MDLSSLNDFTKHGHTQLKICVSGAAETGHCGVDALEKAKELGREIARHGAVLVTGATTGFPLWAAMGVKEEGGTSIGFSAGASALFTNLLSLLKMASPSVSLKDPGKWEMS